MHKYWLPVLSINCQIGSIELDRFEIGTFLPAFPLTALLPLRIYDAVFAGGVTVRLDFLYGRLDRRLQRAHIHRVRPRRRRLPEYRFCGGGKFKRTGRGGVDPGTAGGDALCAPRE